MRTEQIDDQLRMIYRQVAAGQISAEAAGAAETALHARRSGRERAGPAEQPRAAPGRPGAARGPGRREKVFGYTYGPVLDRNERARLMHRARAFMRRTAPGRAYGELTAKHVQVLEALVYGFLNSRDGRCFPSLARLAERAGCAISTAQLAIAALERVGLLGWVHRLKRVWIEGRWRVHRTSNGYVINSSNAETPQRSPIQGFFSHLRVAFGDERTARSEREGAFRGGAGAIVRV
jgi:Helix-turn-helix domain